MKIKTIVHIHYMKYSWETKGQFVPLNYKYKDDSNYTYVCDQEIELEVPDNYDPTADMIASLVAQKVKAQADFSKSVAQINEKISKLQALEFKA